MKGKLMKLYIKKNQRLFCIAYILYMLAMFTEIVNMDASRASSIKNVFVICTVGILFFNLLSNYRGKMHLDRIITLRFFIGVLIFMFITLLSVKTTNYFLILVLLFSLNMKDIEFNDLAKLAFYSISVITIMVIIFCALNIFPNIKSVRNTSIHYGQVRNSLGFQGGLFLPNILVYITAFYYSIRGKKINKRNFIIFQALAISVYILCDSRNGMVAIELLLILQFLCQIRGISKRKKNIIYYTGALSYVMVCAFSWMLLQAYRHGNVFANYINILISGRFQWALENMWKTPFRLINWANNAEFNESLRYAYDNGYYYMIARYGYLFLYIFLFITIIVAIYLKKQENYAAIVSFAVVAVLNFIDNGLISYGFFPYLILGVHYLTSSIKKSKKEFVYDIVSANDKAGKEQEIG